jgi:hypothetical protein
MMVLKDMAILPMIKPHSNDQRTVGLFVIAHISSQRITRLLLNEFHKSHSTTQLELTLADTKVRA